MKGSATESELRLSVAGQAGVNLMDFCKLFNARTAKYKEGLELPVKLQAYNDRTFDFTVATPSASYFLKAAVRNPTPSQSVRVHSGTGLQLATLLATLSGYLSPKGFLTLFLTLNVTNVDHRNWCGDSCALCGALCSRMGSLRPRTSLEIGHG